LTKEFKGSYGVLVTPFTADGKLIDTQKLKNLIDWQIQSKSPGIIVLGTTGEFLAISDDERDLVIETAVKHVAGRIDVLVGTTNAYTPKAVRYSKKAQELGCNGLMILPPYYYTPTHEEIFQYYKAICDEVSVPIMLYNNPFTSNVDMPAKLVAKLAKSFEQVRYIKEASQDIARVRDVIEESNGLVKVFAGERVVESYQLGATGYVNPYANYIPEASTIICEYLSLGRIEDAKSINRFITKIDHIIAEGHPTYGHQCYSKALASVRGYPVGDVRPPITKFADLGTEGADRVKKIKVLMDELDLLLAKLAS
jgi:4-hydroxy-tetrahydrodipicolinate synthase